MTPLPDSEPYRLPEPACLIRRVRIQNYKSIRLADVSLGPFTILVGRNGSGKSNFLDALHFVADSLRDSLEKSILTRGGAKAIFRRDKRSSGSLSIGLTISLPRGKDAQYKFVLVPRQGNFIVQRESLLVRSGESAKSYEVHKGVVEQFPAENPPPASAERLYLGQASGFPPFGEVYDSLLSMGFYNLNPDVMREPQAPDIGKLLNRDGSNIASVVRRLRKRDPEAMSRIHDYLAVIVPGIEEVRSVLLGPRETLAFVQQAAEAPARFYATNMSDGTLRAVGVLVAIAQLSERKKPVTLVGIEEPEAALHPAAARALMDALREASVETQVVVTTHSPDLLDLVQVDHESLLAVTSVDGITRIAPIDKVSRETISEALFSPGELLRLDQIEPDREDLARQEQTRASGAEDDDAPIADRSNRRRTR